MFFWTFRKNEKDVVKLYNTLSPVMQIATGGNMLNFGYWSSENSDPISAQENLCTVFGNLSELSTKGNFVDVEFRNSIFFLSFKKPNCLKLIFTS